MRTIKKMTTKISERIPNTKHLYQVYGVIVMLIYGWSLYQFFWMLPGWLKYQPTNNIFSIFSYTLVNDLFESLLILVCIILIAIILPAKWFREGFVLRGGLTVLYFLILTIVIAYNEISLKTISANWIWSLVGLGVLHFIAGKTPIVQKIIENIADASTIFLFLSLPLSLLSLVVIIIRNL